jgi:hypothetical protein
VTTVPTLIHLARTRATAVWFVLIAATALSWVLGTDHSVDNHRLASTLILTVAFIKVRFVGLDFMELRDAPLPLRRVFEAYCAIVLTAVLVLYLAG